MKDFAATLETLKALPVGAAILDASGTIMTVNDTWKDFARRNGLRLPNFAIGANYLDYCASDEAQSASLAKDMKALLAGRLALLTLIYPCHSPRVKRWFSLVAVPLSPGRPGGVALLHVNLTGMLPLLPDAKPARGGTASDALGGAIERAVSAARSSQLTAFLGVSGGEPARKTGAVQPQTDSAHPRTLSKRQMQIFRLLGEGKTNKEIAEQIFRSPNTVKLHVSAILQRLKLSSRTQAAVLASKLHADATADPDGEAIMTWKRP